MLNPVSLVSVDEILSDCVRNKLSSATIAVIAHSYSCFNEFDVSFAKKSGFRLDAKITKFPISMQNFTKISISSLEFRNPKS